MYSDGEDEEQAVLVTQLYKLVPPDALHNPSGVKRAAAPRAAGSLAPKTKTPELTVAAYDPRKRRLYFGLTTGELYFWVIDSSLDATRAPVRYVGAHTGPVSAICAPSPEDGVLGKAGLLLSGSADGAVKTWIHHGLLQVLLPPTPLLNVTRPRPAQGKAGLLLSGSVDGAIKIWDYQGRVLQEPTVCVQTLYGHTGTLTGLFVYGEHVLSCSTDRTIRAWKRVDGRENLKYPWFDLQCTLATLDGWVRSMSFSKDDRDGDHGTFYAVNETGGITRLIPEEVLHDDGRKMVVAQVFKVVQGMPGSSVHSAGTTTANSPLDRGVLLVRYIAQWQLLLTLAYDNCLRTYDTVTSVMKHEWENENRCHFTGLEVDLEFGEILAVDGQGMLSIFSVRSGQLFATKQLCQNPISSIRRVLGRQCYAVTTARDVTLWRVQHDLEYNVLRGGHEKAVVALYACAGGAGATAGEQDYRVFSASLDNTVRLWDPYDMACVRVLGDDQSEVSAMTFYEAWNILITGHDSGDIRLWDVDTGRSHTLRQHTNTVSCLAMAMFRRSEELLISGGFDGLVVVWDVRSHRGEPPCMLAKFKAHGPGSGAPAMFGPRAALAARAKQQTRNARGSGSGAAPGEPGAGGTMAAAAAAAAAAGLDGPEASYSSLGNYGGYGGSYSFLAAEPSDVSGRNGGASNLATAASQDAASPAPPDVAGTASAAALTLTGALGREDSTGANGAAAPAAAAALPAWRLSGSDPEVLAVKYDPIKKVIFTAGNDHTIKVWSVNGYVYRGRHQGHTAPVSCMALDANFLFSGSDDCSIRVWDAVPAPAEGTDGTALLLTGFTSTVALKVLTGHTSSVTAVEVLDGRGGQLLSCSRDGSLRFWDYVTGEQLHRFNHHEEMRCLALRADCPEVLVGTMQASILRFPLPEAVADGMADILAEAGDGAGVGATVTEVFADGAAAARGGEGAGTAGRDSRGSNRDGEVRTPGAGSASGAGSRTGTPVKAAAEPPGSSGGGGGGMTEEEEEEAARKAASFSAHVVRTKRTAASVGKFTTQLVLPSANPRKM